jgi:hypothetical protein
MELGKSSMTKPIDASKMELIGLSANLKGVICTVLCIWRGVGRGGPARNLSEQLTLFKPGGRLCSSHYCQPPPDYKSYLHLW